MAKRIRASLDAALDRAERWLGRVVIPLMVATAALRGEPGKSGWLIEHILAQPRVWVIGDEHSLIPGPGPGQGPEAESGPRP